MARPGIEPGTTLYLVRVRYHCATQPVMCEEEESLNSTQQRGTSLVPVEVRQAWKTAAAIAPF
jgi:hypothetical protein